MKNNEVWKYLDDKHRVSSLGRAQYLKGSRWHRWVFKASGQSQYLQARYKGQHVALHRLVCAAFNPNTLNLPQVHHKDGNIYNNAANNLKWCTNEQNQYYNSRQIVLYWPLVNGQIVRARTFDNAQELADFTGWGTVGIRRAARKHRPTHCGYYIEYFGSKVMPQGMDQSSQLKDEIKKIASLVQELAADYKGNRGKTNEKQPAI